MFVLASTEMGVAAKVTEDVISGQFVKLTHLSPDDRVCSLVTTGDMASGAVSGTAWGLAYYDPMKAAWERPEGGADFYERVPFMTSPVPDATAKAVFGRFVTVLRGRIRGWTNQVDDGYYMPGQYLTVNPVTKRLKLADPAVPDPVHGQIEQMQRPVQITGQNNGVEVIIVIPGGGLV